MAGFGVVWRVIAYTSEDDTTELFRAHSGAGLTNPYVSAVSVRGRRIDVPHGTATAGQATVRVLDKRSSPGDQTTRWLTTILGDAEGRNALRSSRIEIDVSDDGGSTFMREFTGRCRKVRLVGKLQYEILVDDLRVDERSEIFDGTDPSLLVDWATPPVMAPVGDPGGQLGWRYGEHPLQAPLDGTFEYSTGLLGTVYAVRARETGPRYVLTSALRAHASFTQVNPLGSSSLGQHAPDLRVAFKPAVDPDYLKFTAGTFYGEIQLPKREGFVVEGSSEEPRHLRRIAVAKLPNDDTVPADGTLGQFYVYSVAPPRKNSPLHIGTGTANSGVHWAVLVSGVANKVFGGAGFDLDYPRFAELAADDTQPKLRFRITEGPTSGVDWLEENVWPVVGFAPSVTASGTLYPVSYDPPESTAGLFTVDSSVVVDGTWEQSRTGEVNHVRFETIQEQSIPPDLWDESTPVDAIEEHEGDRIITARDSGRKRRQFKVIARGLRAFSGSDPIRETRKFAEARSDAILDRLQDGPQVISATLRRTDDTKNIRVGDHNIVQVPWQPDLNTQARGGPRLALCVSRDLNPDGTYTFKWLDAGPDVFAGTPTLDTVVANSTEPRHVMDVTVTPPGDPDRAVVQFAVTNSGISAPAGGDERWSHVFSLGGSSQTTFGVPNLPSRRRVHFRTQGRGPGKVPTAFSATKSAHTAAIAPPTGLIVTISGASAIATWSNGDADYRVMPVLDGADFLDNALPAGSKKFIFTEIAATTAFDFGVKHVDDFGGDSTVTDVNDTTDSNGQLQQPREIVVRQGEGDDVSKSMPRQIEFGTGIELQWTKTEPYAATVIQYDTSATFDTSPVALSGVFDNHARLNFPLDDTKRFFRVAHHRTGWDPSEWSESVFAKPVPLIKDPQVRDGVATGYAFLSLNDTAEFTLHVGTEDPDTDRAYYTVNLTGFVEPTTTNSGISRTAMPYSQTTGITTQSGTAYMWVKFHNNQKGFGRSVQHALAATGATISDGSITTPKLADGAVVASKLIASAQNFSFDGTWSAPSQAAVSWTAGTLYFADTTTFSIDAGTLSSMTDPPTLYYIYFNQDVSTTVLQTTTSEATATNQPSVLLAVAQKGATATQDAFIVPSVGVAKLNNAFMGQNAIIETNIKDDEISTPKLKANSVTAAKIAALTITANELAANSVTAAKINVATLSAISADVGTLTAGLIQNSAGARYIDLDATGNNPFIKADNFEIQADGDTSITATVVATSFEAHFGGDKGIDLDATGARFFNASGTLRMTIQAFGVATAGVITTPSGADLELTPGDDLTFNPGSGRVWFFDTHATDSGSIVTRVPIKYGSGGTSGKIRVYGD